MADDAGDFAARTVRASNAARQRQDRCVGAACHQRGEHQPDRAAPVAEGQQHHAMHHQREVDGRHQPVGLQEASVGETLDQRDGRQHDKAVEGPLADGFGQAALFLEEAEDFDSLLWARAALRARQPAPAHGPFRPLGPQPVDGRQRQAGDAQPFVQAVALVEPTQERLEPQRAQCEQHRHAHDAHREDAGVMHGERADREVAAVAEVHRVGQPPQQTEPRQDQDESELDAFHDVTLVKADRPGSRYRADRCNHCAPRHGQGLYRHVGDADPLPSPRFVRVCTPDPRTAAV